MHLHENDPEKINAYKKKKESLLKQSTNLFFSFCFFSFLSPSPVGPPTLASVSTLFLYLLAIPLGFCNALYICREESLKLYTIG